MIHETDQWGNLMRSWDLKSLRESAELSQAELGARIGMSQSQVSRFEAEPDTISLGDLRRWNEACKSPAGGGVRIPTTGGELARHAREVLDKYLDRWTTPGPIIERSTLPTREIAKRALYSVVRKPIITMCGHTDSGKTKTVNSLLGDDVLPVRLGALTRAMCILVHSQDRPSWAREDCYLLGANFDPLYWFDREEVMSNLLHKGQLRSLVQYVAYEQGEFATAEGQSGRVNSIKPKGNAFVRALKAFSLKARGQSQSDEGAPTRSDIFYAIIFVAVPILESCILIDPPGFSSAEADSSLAQNALQLADAALVHFPIIASGQKQKVGADAELFHGALSCLADSTRLEGRELMDRVWIVTTHFPNEAQLEAITYTQDYAAKIASIVAEMPTGRTRYRVEAEDMSAALAANSIAMTFDDGKGRPRLFAAMRVLVQEKLDRFWADALRTEITKASGFLAAPFRNEAAVVASNIERIAGAVEELKRYDANLINHEMQKTHEKRALLELSHEYEAQVENAIAVRFNLATDWREVREFITRKFGEDEKERAQASAYTYLLADIRKEFEIESLRRLGQIDMKTLAFLKSWQGRVTALDFSAADDKRLLDDQTLGSVLSAVGGVVLGTAGVLTFLAATATFPPLVLLIPFLGIFALLGDWREKLAKNLAKEIAKGSQKKQFIDANRQVWNDWRGRFDKIYFEAEAAEARYISNLRDVVNSSDEAVRSRLQSELDALRLGETFFSNLPSKEAVDG